MPALAISKSYKVTECMNYSEYADILTWANTQIDPVTQREWLMTGLVGHLWTTDILVSKMVTRGTIYCISEPEFVGVMPIRQDVNVIPADKPWIKGGQEATPDKNDLLYAGKSGEFFTTYSKKTLDDLKCFDISENVNDTDYQQGSSDGTPQRLARKDLTEIKIQSVLHGDMQSAAEMTAPSLEKEKVTVRKNSGWVGSSTKRLTARKIL